MVGLGFRVREGLGAVIPVPRTLHKGPFSHKQNLMKRSMQRTRQVIMMVMMPRMVMIVMLVMKMNMQMKLAKMIVIIDVDCSLSDHYSTNSFFV